MAWLQNYLQNITKILTGIHLKDYNLPIYSLASTSHLVNTYISNVKYAEVPNC